jgi:hypothetical protein
MTIAFFEGVDPNGNAAGQFFGQYLELVGSTNSGGWVEFTQTYPVPAGAGSFDVRFRVWEAQGSLYADDISAQLIPEPSSLCLLGLAGVALLRRR